MYRKYFLLFFLLTLSIASLSAQQVIQNGKKLYLSNTLIVKVKNNITSAQFNNALAKFSINNVTELYPTNSFLKKGAGVDILSGIYLVKYNTMEDPEKLAAEVARMPNVLWAEPKYIQRICYTPDDTLFISGDQENLIQINAPAAWDITTGNKNIIIGIVDTGVDWGHPDLAVNIYMENDSLVPGSDLGNQDDDPSEDIYPGVTYHGTLVAGIAGAVTDNEIGIASVGFNCSILPVKVSVGSFKDAQDSPYILYGYEGIKWAADHGAKVINCSWGGYGYSAFNQAVIDYALAKGAMVVAAQGNDSSSADFYPADYDGVLSVGWLETGINVKTINTKANYGRKVKVFAPGSHIYSTWQRPTESSAGIYRQGNGSSLSTSHVSGLAGLVWSEFPYYTPIQIEERIRVTSDNIYDYQDNSYKYLLGHGAINTFRAIDKSVKAISVRADSIQFIDLGDGDGIFDQGEDVLIKLNFTNYLASVNNLVVTLTTNDSLATIENGTFYIGSMDTLTTVSNESDAFKFKLAPKIPHKYTIHFLLQYTNGTDYNDFQWIYIIANNTEPYSLLSDYIYAIKGDTLVIKDYYVVNKQLSLPKVLLLDSVDVPAGRVYELKRNGYYPFNTLKTQRNTVIVGEDNRILVNNDDAGSALPLITGRINAAHNLTIKNCNITESVNYGPPALAVDSPNIKMIIDNCLFEHTKNVFASVNQADCNVTFRNCYFVNMNGKPGRHNGGVFDCYANLDTLLVENCTHLMAQGSMYRLRYNPENYKFRRIIFNHNTFINCSGNVFMNSGYHSNISLTNNILVNCNIQSYQGYNYTSLYEQDPDGLPMGLVNVYPDSADIVNNTARKFLCQNNLVYWDSLLADMDSILNARTVNYVTDWQSQMIIMNSRTDSMFKHKEPYNTTPYLYLVTDTWKNQILNFTDPKDLFTTQLANVKTFSLMTVDNKRSYRTTLPDWRLVHTSKDKYLYADWPIPVDLSYNNTEFMNAGLGDFPLGDLNWFPNQKAKWLAQRITEYKSIDDALNTGKLVIDVPYLPVKFVLWQNYPNPFNSITIISYQLAVDSDVDLKIYDVLGREVAKLVNEKQNKGIHFVHFNGSSLASGVYFYYLKVNGYEATKKMVILK